jgi:hypothetical protein
MTPRPFLALLALGALLLEACSSTPPREPPIDPDVARADIRSRIPATVANRDGWAIDMFAAFEAMEVRLKHARDSPVMNASFTAHPSRPAMIGIDTSQDQRIANREEISCAQESSRFHGSPSSWRPQF